MAESPSTTTAWPTQLRLSQQGRVLSVTFDTGESFDLTAEFLRVSSPSAEVRGHGQAEPKIEAGKRNVAIREIHPTGNYAVRLSFDDGHDTGIYTWTYLYELGAGQEKLWQTYLNALESKGFSRG